jgi:hypothetical protein
VLQLSTRGEEGCYGEAPWVCSAERLGKAPRGREAPRICTDSRKTDLGNKGELENEMV